MATYRITAPDGASYEITAPDDATQDQVMAYAQANYAQAGQPKQPQSAQQPGPLSQMIMGQRPTPQRSALENIGRQVGLTGRYALEGGAQILDLPGALIRSGLGAMGVQSDLPSESASKLADSLGLPKPETGLERGVAAATRGGFGAAVPAGLASQAVKGTTGMTRGILSTMAANPAAQIGGGVGGGTAADVAKNAGLNEIGQMVAGLAGGVAGGMVGNAAMNAAGRASEAVGRRVGLDALPDLKPKRMSDTELSAVLRNRLSITGGDWDAIPANVQKSLMTDLRKANTLEGLDARAAQRLADFRALEVTPTRGTVTRDPIQFTNEKNLAKTGANSNLANIQGLAQMENANNNRLIQLLQGVEGGRETDAIAAGRALSGNIAQQRDALRAAESAAWREARATPGYRMPMQANVLGDINAALDDAGLMPFMDSRISSYIQALQTNPDQFTPQAYRNLQSMLSNTMRAGGNEAAAAGVARDILEQARMQPAASQIFNPGSVPATARTAQQMRATDPMPGDAMSAIDRARQATRAAYGFEDSSPLVRSALSEGATSDPARLAQRFIINGTPDEAAQVARNLTPEGRRVVRDALATHIKRRALNGAADEVGNISQKSLNSALSSLGPEKLGLFFSPEDIQQLQRIGRVSSYIQAQPTGGAVNNSNSGALIAGKGLNALMGITSKIPFLNIDQQADALLSMGRTANALRANRGLLAPQAPEYGLLSNAGSGAAMGGLLAIPKGAESSKDNKRK